MSLRHYSNEGTQSILKHRKAAAVRTAQKSSTKDCYFGPSLQQVQPQHLSFRTEITLKWLTQTKRHCDDTFSAGFPQCGEGNNGTLEIDGTALRLGPRKKKRKSSRWNRTQSSHLLPKQRANPVNERCLTNTCPWPL